MIMTSKEDLPIYGELIGSIRKAIIAEPFDDLMGRLGGLILERLLEHCALYRLKPHEFEVITGKLDKIYSSLYPSIMESK